MNKNIIFNFGKTFVSLLLPLILSNCYMEKDIRPKPRWQAEAQQTALVIELPFSKKHPGITANDQRHIRDYIEQAKMQGKGLVYARIKIKSLKSGFDDLDQDPRVKNVMKILKKYGLPERNIEIIQDPDLKFYSLDDNEQKTGLYLSIDSYRIKPLKCPGFDRQSMDGRVPPEGEAHFGCTTEENFAAMIAEPRDLHHGQKLSGNDPVLSVDAIERLRTDKVKTLKVEKMDGSSGSGAGG